MIGILVLLSGGFPVIFSQKRAGQGSTLFYIYKFRTMKIDTPNVASNLLKDPGKYLLAVGGLLRKLSLDELPNLVNIAKGDMSFVGPRPALFNQFDLLQLRLDAGVTMLKPGLTGWAQINGRDKLSVEEKVALEKEYLEKKSFLLDVSIVIRTVFFIFSKKEEVNH